MIFEKYDGLVKRPVDSELTKMRWTGRIIGMKVIFSNQGNLRNVRKFFEKMDLSEPKRLSVQMEGEWIAAHPAQLAITASLALQAGKWESEIGDEVPDSAKVLAEMGLYEFVGSRSSFKGVVENEKEMIPLMVVRDEGERAKLMERIGRLDLGVMQRRVVQFLVGSLVDNALEWSGVAPVVAVKYYRKSRRVGLAVCDAGKGLWGSLDEAWRPRNDLEAVEMALRPGVNGGSERLGGGMVAGMGLFAARGMAKLTRDYFVIYSGTGMYELMKGDKRARRRLKMDPMQDRHFATNDLVPFLGTLVAVDVSVDEVGDFQEMMNAVVRAYTLALSEAKESKIQYPKIVKGRV